MGNKLRASFVLMAVIMALSTFMTLVAADNQLFMNRDGTVFESEEITVDFDASTKFSFNEALPLGFFLPVTDTPTKESIDFVVVELEELLYLLSEGNILSVEQLQLDFMSSSSHGAYYSDLDTVSLQFFCCWNMHVSWQRIGYVQISTSPPLWVLVYGNRCGGCGAIH